MGKGGQKSLPVDDFHKSSSSSSSLSLSSTQSHLPPPPPPHHSPHTPHRPPQPLTKQWYAWHEVQRHRTPDDAWMVYQNKVYDVSRWHAHPGGAVLFTHAGDDMTDIFTAFHAGSSHKVMEQFYIGDLLPESRNNNNKNSTDPRRIESGRRIGKDHAGVVDDDSIRKRTNTTTSTAITTMPNNSSERADPQELQLQQEQRVQQKQQAAFEKGYRQLRSQLVLMGLFKSNPWFYAYKCVSTMLLWVTGLTLLLATRTDQVSMHVLGAFTLGLFFQQCGWLAHDFLHHQVFKTRKYGDYAGIYWGNLMQGYSVQWWKNKHNGHHAVPNLHSSSALSQDGDPDIDTMPLLAWSLKQAQSFRHELQAHGHDSSTVRFLIQYQAWLYFPILLLARLSWLRESAKTAFGLGASSDNAALELKVRGLQYPVLEKMGIALHYVWVGLACSGLGTFPLAYALALFLIMTCSCGLLLAIVFGLGHNGMATYDADDRPDFWQLQVTTTRNIIGGHGIPQAFVDWFCGGLQYQVDHHLFPTLPRHNLKNAHALVASFCRHWNVHYHEADLIDGSREVLEHLRTVSDQFILDFVRDGPTM